MYLLSEWECRTEKYLVRGLVVGRDRNQVSVWSDFTQSISMLSCYLSLHVSHVGSEESLGDVVLTFSNLENVSCKKE